MSLRNGSVRRLGALAFLVAAAFACSLPAAATTEPASTYFDQISLTEHGIKMSRSKVDVGSLVVFVVHNRSTHPRKIHVGSYRSGLLPPGKKIQFELSFPVPWAFNIVSTGKHLPTLKAKFVCSF